MKNRSLLNKKIELFSNEIAKKRNMKGETRVHMDREFEQNEIKKLNKKFKV